MTNMRKPEAAFEELELKGATKGKKGMMMMLIIVNRIAREIS